ncbi:atypical/ABC1/ABC1-B protein kinase [Reticulomyxa filosa]|uniref:Atypical/ABC1/ABC1-B protein kinase n=1 Tax=Reticulomyxa filosa TaxID=46433 RepID=X6PG37_RETFI|nr:atypical/ABC1/ABC1-B protein kinase [Reticulomyxa filosa]|eukprot:ETO36989.1 atypical/ABC1/ABC1-B protein kinase [Reticulomyxa filosa]
MRFPLLRSAARFCRRFVVYGGLAGFGALYIDDKLHYDRNKRTFRAVWTCLRILYEFKINWDEQALNSELHKRVAEMILETCQKNGGLYIKFGQGVASMNHILPREYNQVFQVLHDKAPSVEFREVYQIIMEDLKVDPHLIFKEFSVKPVASASIAQVRVFFVFFFPSHPKNFRNIRSLKKILATNAQQKQKVHKAVLHNGDEVAVKIQKPYIAKQVPWDLACYKFLLHVFEYFF